MNNVTLYGRLTRDPELRVLPSGGNVCNFSLAINNGTSTTFVNLTAFSKQADLVKEYLHKGDPVVVEGFLYSHSRDINGTNVTELSVTVRLIHFVGSKSKSSSDSPYDYEKPKQEEVVNVTPDEDLPF